MRDSEVVASIVAGNPDGLATAYDKYAGDLYGYCQSLLHEPADAADAVQDTFVIAASKVGALRDPERLRSWLFAVARNECLHRLKARHGATPLQEAPEPADDGPDVGHEAERAETVALVRAAVGGLNDGERDVINQLWHGLEVSEVASVLGVSRSYAYTLFSRARDQLEASVGVLLVGRAGRRDCAALDGLLRDWDGRLTATLRKRVGRHIDKCRVCSDRKRRELTPALLYSLTPGALLALAAQRAVPAFAGFGHAAGPLSAVRDTVLRLAADPSQPAQAYQSAAGGAAHSFGASGFPKPLHATPLGLPHFSVPVVGGTAVAATATVMATAFALGHHGPGSNKLSDGPPGATGPAIAGAGASATPATQPGTAPASGATPSGTASITATRPGATVSVTGTPTATAGNGATPTAAATKTTGPGASAAGPTSSTGPVTPSTTGAPTTGPSATATLTTSPTPGAPSEAGTISASPSTVVLSPLLGGTLTLTANGGPVTWSLAEPASLLGELTVSPMSGTLSAGQSVTVTMTVNVASIDTTLTVEPGDELVTVVLGLL